MTPETMQFKTELKQLLHLIVHSLYSHRDIFLRELISNASDAIDTVRFKSLTHPEVLEDNADWKIKLLPDERLSTLTISDNGVGMSRETIVENLGTIAKSGTKAFLESLKQANAEQRPGLIGQFGVGFYSAFMVADKVTVISRTAGSPAEGVKWESDGQGEFSVETVEKEKRGTDVILHLKPDAREFLQPWTLRQIVKKYSDFVEHPIVMDEEKEEDGKKTTVEETLNARKAIWLRNRNEVTAEEYNAFYKHLTHDLREPLKTIHYSAEGLIEFKALLYIPAERPFDLMFGEGKKGLQLYIQRVFIMDDCEAMLPPYLRFVRGVVDSPDLPLNVSRELLQQSAPLEKIRTNLVGKVLSTLSDMKDREYENYVKFYDELGFILKEGVAQDWSNREKIADLLLFESTRTEPGKYTSLGQYLERMPVSQEAIWFLTGENREMLENSPLLESFRAQDQEVLLMTAPVDEFVAQWLTEYRGKRLKAADRGEAQSGSVDDAKKQAFQGLLDLLKQKVPEVKDVRLTNRLKESAACLVAGEGVAGAYMERILERMGRMKEAPPNKRVLEVNPDHAVLTAMQTIFTHDPADPRLEAYARLLYDQAIIAEGSKVKDPAAFARRINELLVRTATT